MNNLYVYTLFDKKTGRPRCTGIKNGVRVVICDLYRPGAGKTIKKIDTSKKIVKNILLKANAEQRKIIISDFKSHIKAFDLPYNHKTWNVYDVHLKDVQSSNSSGQDNEIVVKILNRLSRVTPQEYQKVLAQAATVYQDLENTGLLINHDPTFPKWSQKTFSGRSKTTGFNIQGFHENWHVVPQGGNEYDVMIHFDWVCADIRIASILSQDDILNDTFINSDPYTVLMNKLNNGSDEKISREESKRYLLKSINSMDFTSVALTEVYPRLGKWIRRCKETIVEGRPLKTILGRKFRLKQSKNELAVLNGVMQGSVAHAMHLVLKRIWDRLPNRLIAEIHDCLVVSAAPDSTEIKAVIDIIAPIMLHPFEGVLNSNPAFPFNISIGKKWKKWKLHETHRELEVINVARQRKEEARDSEESCREGLEKEVETA